MTQAIELNGVTYQWPKRPVVVVCIDGGDPAYFERGLSDGILPNIRQQYVYRDRQSAVGSRYIGELLSRS